jgi:hypothetical protein
MVGRKVKMYFDAIMLMTSSLNQGSCYRTENLLIPSPVYQSLMRPAVCM